MVVTDELVYVELRKTGSSHIQWLLRELIGGERRGMHGRPDPLLLKSSRHFIGSIRNPWDWYVSLWAFGCQGDGKVQRRLTKGHLSGHGWRREPLQALRRAWRNMSRDHREWQRLYSDPMNDALFREWLVRLHAENVGPYMGSPLSEEMGVLSRFYANSFWRPRTNDRNAKTIDSVEKAKRIDQEECYIDHFVRTEHIDDDLIGVLKNVFGKVEKKEKRKIRSENKKNASQKRKKAKFYYDEKTCNLVNRKDNLIIDKFGYSPPIN